MSKIPLLLLFLTFAAYGQSPMSIFTKSYDKCCCNKDANEDKDCRNIVWQALEYLGDQEYAAKNDNIFLWCAIVNSEFACGTCGGPTCPGEKRCPDGIDNDKSYSLDDLDDL
jgi:hypothetical protein